MSAAGLLKRALRKLKRGVAESVFLDGDGRYCILGAVYSAAGCPDDLLRRAYPLQPQKRTKFHWNEPFSFPAKDGVPEDVEMALRAMEKVIRRAEFGGSYDAYRGIAGERGLAVFSDDHPELVIPVIRQAIKEVG
jgi:hypothetical protein